MNLREEIEVEISGQKVLLDRLDWEFFSNYKWYVDAKSEIPYVYTRIYFNRKKHVTTMHRLITGMTHGVEA